MSKPERLVVTPRGERWLTASETNPPMYALLGTLRDVGGSADAARAAIADVVARADALSPAVVEEYALALEHFAALVAAALDRGLLKRAGGPGCPRK